MESLSAEVNQAMSWGQTCHFGALLSCFFFPAPARAVVHYKSGYKKGIEREKKWRIRTKSITLRTKSVNGEEPETLETRRRRFRFLVFNSSWNLFDDMGGGSGNEAPRPSWPFNSIRMNGTEPLQLRNVSVNSAATLVNPRQPCAIPAGDVPGSIVLPVASSGTGKQMPFIPYVKQKSTFTPSVGTSGVDSCMSIVNRTDTETTSNFKRPLCPFGIHPLMEEFVVPMRYNSIKQESNEDRHGSSELQSNVKILSGESRAQASTRDKLRRAKISEAIKTLQDIVPCSDPNNKDAVLDDVIDYVKFLKLQLKVLSQSRLNGEAAPHPLVYLDGYGHYLFNQQMCNEPLEEMMGQLMESDRQAAHNLLENKGLTILPMDLAYTLLQNNLEVLSEANCA